MKLGGERHDKNSEILIFVLRLVFFKGPFFSAFNAETLKTFNTEIFNTFIQGDISTNTYWMLTVWQVKGIRQTGHGSWPVIFHTLW